MKNFSDKNVMIIILITIFFVFGLIFTVKSPERKIIDSPLMWREDFSDISLVKRENTFLMNNTYLLNLI